jgi:hypothetical protein
MSTIEEILKTPITSFEDGSAWLKLDEVIDLLPDFGDRIRRWAEVLSFAEGNGLPTGHPHFRLGLLHLLSDADERVGLEHLERAYQQDRKWRPQQAHRMAAYRVLCLTKGLIGDLKQRNDHDPQKQQLKTPHRFTLIATIFRLYDETRAHLLDMPILTFPSFFALLKDDNLRLFAGQNYYCAHDLLEFASTHQSFVNDHEYALARAVIGLYGGVLEAILADKLPKLKGSTLGGLITEAYKQKILSPGTHLAALSTVMLYFRNHIHADKEKKDYFVDLNVAKGCKVALDFVIFALIPNAAPAP